MPPRGTGKTQQKSLLHARALAPTMSAPPFPATSGRAASKSAIGNSTPYSQRARSNEPLGIQLGVHDADAREIAARLGEAGDQPGRDRVGAAHKDDRDHRGRSFRRSYRRDGDRCNHVDLTADEVGGQGGQPIVPEFGPTVFDRHVLSRYVAGFAESLVESGQQR